MPSRQDRDYEYIGVTWGIKIAKFLVEMELFPVELSSPKKKLKQYDHVMDKG